jgi:signal transduction histidine kinase
MGLALLADMAIAAGCSLTVRSAPGAGTTVKLEVPE